MKTYAELLENLPIGSKVRVTYKDGRLVASQNLAEGQFGVIKALVGKTAFVEIASVSAHSDSGSALGVTLDLPTKAAGSLNISVEED